jgi:hypothetical protein
LKKHKPNGGGVKARPRFVDFVLDMPENGSVESAPSPFLLVTRDFSVPIFPDPGPSVPERHILLLYALPAHGRRTMMNEWDSIAWKTPEQKRLSRRNLIRAGAGAFVGAGLLGAKPAFADDFDERGGCALAKPIPGGVTPFKPFGVVVHHFPLNPANQLDVGGINDPSQITDFHGFVGLTHIRGGGTGTNTETGDSTILSFQADMGFSQGKFIGIDGRQHEGTFAFV